MKITMIRHGRRIWNMKIFGVASLIQIKPNVWVSYKEEIRAKFKIVMIADSLNYIPINYISSSKKLKQKKYKS